MPWNNEKPTPISTPAKPARTGNPFQKSSFSNNFDNSGAGPSRRNPVSSRVLVRTSDAYLPSTTHSNKRRKLEDRNTYSKQLAHHSSLADENEPIEIDDIEDFESASTSNSNAQDLPGFLPKGVLGASDSLIHHSMKECTPIHPVERRRPLDADGESTVRMKNKYQPMAANQSGISSGVISKSDVSTERIDLVATTASVGRQRVQGISIGPSSSSPDIPYGIVRNTVGDIEGRRAFRHINLKPQSKIRGMQGKQPNLPKTATTSIFFRNIKPDTPTPSISKLESRLTDFPIIKWSLRGQLRTSSSQTEVKKQDLYLLRVDLDSDASDMQMVNQSNDIFAKISTVCRGGSITASSPRQDNFTIIFSASGICYSEDGDREAFENETISIMLQGQKNPKDLITLHKLLQAQCPSREFLDETAARVVWEGLELDVGRVNVSKQAGTIEEPSLNLSKREKSPISRRQLRTRKPLRPQSPDQREPSVDDENLEEIILVYPHSGPGAVNVCRGDLRRLGPGEYLNDVLIELGLKMWMSDIRSKSPELADQIHVFSSFFYKKLNNRNVEEGFISLRKWTAKVDIFRKKYIVVPINEHTHWYLAIIYHPEHVLVSSKPELRRTSRKVVQKESSSSTTPVDDETISEPSTVEKQSKYAASSSSGEVELSIDNLELHREGRSNNDQSDAASVGSVETWNQASPHSSGDIDKEGQSTAFANLSRTIHAVDSLSLDENPPEDAAAVVSTREDNTSAMDVDEIQDAIEPSDNLSSEDQIADSSHPGGKPGPGHEHGQSTTDQSDDNGNFVSSSNFYGWPSSAFKASTVERSRFPLNLFENDTDRASSIAYEEEPEAAKTYIFIMDSLGSKHPQAIKLLQTYLQLEASDKKGIDDASKAEGKRAQVPVQPNYCDCGLYLLHFARTFLSDPAHYCELIASPPKKPYTAKERREQWKEEVVEGMRIELRTRILTESEQWKAERQRKEAEKKQQEDGTAPNVEDSDDDEIVLESMTIPTKRMPGKKKGKATEVVEKPVGSSRLRG